MDFDKHDLLVPTTPAPPRRPSPYALIQKGKSPSIPALAAPRLPAEARRPRRTLRSVIKRCSARKRARIALALAQELAALHADGTVVGALSPDTVKFGMSGYPEIADIGKADLTSPYAAPELSHPRAKDMRFHGTAAADTFALGALLYFILTGREAPIRWTPRVFARLSESAAALVARCVSDDPRARPYAAEVVVDVERAGLRKLTISRLSQVLAPDPNEPLKAWSIASVVAITGTAALLVLAGTATTAMGAVGVAAMLVGASITAGSSF